MLHNVPRVALAPQPRHPSVVSTCCLWRVAPCPPSADETRKRQAGDRQTHLPFPCFSSVFQLIFFFSRLRSVLLSFFLDSSARTSASSSSTTTIVKPLSLLERLKLGASGHRGSSLLFSSLSGGGGGAGAASKKQMTLEEIFGSKISTSITAGGSAHSRGIQATNSTTIASRSTHSDGCTQASGGAGSGLGCSSSEMLVSSSSLKVSSVSVERREEQGVSIEEEAEDLKSSMLKERGRPGEEDKKDGDKKEKEKVADESDESYTQSSSL